jgi:hypothetical protein
MKSPFHSGFWMAQTDMALTPIGQRNNPCASKAARARFPKFAIRRGNIDANFGKQRAPASL